jgi:hypothetical protein
MGPLVASIGAYAGAGEHTARVQDAEPPPCVRWAEGRLDCFLRLLWRGEPALHTLNAVNPTDPVRPSGSAIRDNLGNDAAVERRGPAVGASVELPPEGVHATECDDGGRRAANSLAVLMRFALGNALSGVEGSAQRGD